MTYKFLENVVKLESNLMQESIHWEGKDKGMSEMYAQDRNDVITAKKLFNEGDYQILKCHIDDLDTSIRDGVVMAFAEDMGKDWVANILGWNVG
jgi:hypothetical protein|tara:strand:- start:2202 stop:2483 length:282 start_codon:yes stop_codon:yes gene_type:complete